MNRKCDFNIFAIKEGRGVNKITLNELHGIFTTYEFRMKDIETSRNEETFKISNKEEEMSSRKDKTKPT
jgi:hypothetical protein